MPLEPFNCYSAKCRQSAKWRVKQYFTVGQEETDPTCAFCGAGLSTDQQHLNGLFQNNRVHAISPAKLPLCNPELQVENEVYGLTLPPMSGEHDAVTCPDCRNKLGLPIPFTPK